jgi:hypothetical protein
MARNYYMMLSLLRVVAHDAIVEIAAFLLLLDKVTSTSLLCAYHDDQRSFPKKIIYWRLILGLLADADKNGFRVDHARACTEHGVTNVSQE